MSEQKWRPERWATHSVKSYTHKDAKDCTGREIFEAGADAMLASIREEIEKVENPYKEFEGESFPYFASRCAFEVCRERILNLLGGEMTPDEQEEMEIALALDCPYEPPPVEQKESSR